MALTFSFKEVPSALFGSVHRPVAWVKFWSRSTNKWVGVWMIIDSGADYSLLPRYMSDYLDISLKRDCKKFSTIGVGGKETVYLLKKAKIKLGDWEIAAPVGFLENNTIPPLLGRQGFMEKFATLFFNHKTTFANTPPIL